MDLTDNDKIVQIKKHSQHDYVFQLKEGVNFLRLLNLVNPTEQCLWKANRLSFEYRSYEDEQLTYKLEEKTTGLVPSLSCQSPCASCQNVNKQFCLSCINPKSMLLLKESGKCILRSQVTNGGRTCPASYFLDGKSGEGVCSKCSLGCAECQDNTGLCSRCSSKHLLNQTSGTCVA